MLPIEAFVIAVGCSELVQLALWGMAHPKQNPLGYFRDGWAHFVMAWGVCTMICLLWKLQALDVVLSLVPEARELTKMGLPYTDRVGALLGFGTDFIADRIVFALRARFGSTPTSAPAAVANEGAQP